MNSESFIQEIQSGYTTKGPSITLGAAKWNGQTYGEAHVQLPLKMWNRHGLIAGATGTGKTKTIQVLSEQLSLAGIPVLMMDIKGDFSGIAQPGVEQDFILERHTAINIPYSTKGFPVELLSLSDQPGVRMRATVSEFGPVLLSRILDLNETQTGIMSLIFKYCDDHHLPLLDLKDLKKVLNYITEEGKSEIEAEYGKISSASTGTILRRIIEIEQQGGDLFFGELSFDVSDLMRVNSEGLGYVNILRLNDIQDKPKLFSTFMLSLLAEIYSTMPEQGDAGQPELVIFIDEAHLIFKEASKTLSDQIETIIKLIRSKGIGIYFITQNPMDIPSGVLSQLGLKIQHALRAFTAKDRQSIKQTAENYPLSAYYKTDQELTSLGIGEALVTGLNEKGIPTPLAATVLRSPMSRMDVLTESEIQAINQNSKLVRKYAEVIDRDSAYEMLTRRIESIEAEAAQQKKAETAAKTATKTSSSTTPRRSSSDSIGTTLAKSIVKTVTSATFIRGVFNMLTGSKRK